MKVKYAATYTISAPTVSSVGFLPLSHWRLNCPFDPAATANVGIGGSGLDSGQQYTAIGHATYSQHYNRYICYGASARATITNLTPARGWNAYLHVLPASAGNSNGSVSTIYGHNEDTLRVSGFPTRRAVIERAGSGGETKTLNLGYVSVERIEGLPRGFLKMNHGSSALPFPKPDFAANINGYPGISPLIELRVFSNDGVNVVVGQSCRVRVEIVYYVEYYMRRQIGADLNTTIEIVGSDTPFPGEGTTLPVQSLPFTKP